MLEYVFNEVENDDDPIMFSAENQCWDAATLKQLKEEYDIVFMTNDDAVIPVMVLNKNTDYPLLVLGSEDDGTITFKRKYGNFVNCFSPYWVKSLIADLQEAVKLCKKKFI